MLIDNTWNGMVISRHEYGPETGLKLYEPASYIGTGTQMLEIVY
ncbi:MAG: hypothetical protein XD45_0758 [Thermotoga sp. 50_64]|nr:MAG: hypothetical protein XD45_0758 [Thermotoga sp. 50_64]